MNLANRLHKHELYLTLPLPHVKTKLDQHDGSDRLCKQRMVGLLPRDDDDDQSIADDLSYQLIIVPSQEMGVQAV